jgi:hypothetical protein
VPAAARKMSKFLAIQMLIPRLQILPTLVLNLRPLRTRKRAIALSSGWRRNVRKGSWRHSRNAVSRRKTRRNERKKNQ